VIYTERQYGMVLTPSPEKKNGKVNGKRLRGYKYIKLAMEK